MSVGPIHLNSSLHDISDISLRMLDFFLLLYSDARDVTKVTWLKVFHLEHLPINNERF